VIGNPVTSLSWADTVFLPDGTYCEPYGCSYRSPLVFTDFAEGAEVSSVDDILYVRLNLEHSFAGDLYINITCPNGQKADILRFNGTANSDCSSSIPLASRHWQSGDNAGTGTFFGMAYDHGVQSCNESLPNNAPGIGWNYCWSNNATAGYTYASGEGGLIYRYDNAHYQDNFYDMSPQRVRIFDSSNVATGTQFYHPDQSFASLIGCPLNGPWYIEVMDGFNVDNGYLFGWELALAPHLVPGEHTDVASVTMDGPWVTPVSDTAFIVSPPEDLARDTVITYTFHLSDTIGCGYDTTVTLNVYARSFTVIDTSACDSFTWNGNAYTNSGQYIDTFANRHGCDSIVTLNLTVYPTPVVQIEGPSWVCRDSVVVFSVDSCAAYLWSTGDTTRMISVAEAGTYSVTVTEEHGCSYTATHDLATPANPILSVNSPEICADTISPITVGTSSGSTVVLSANASNFIIVFQGLWLSDSGMSTPAVCPPADLEQDTAVVCAVMLVDTNGCHFDTTVTVTVYSLSHSSFDTVVCDSFTYAGVTYSESGQYEHAFETVHGCDSVVTFTLTVNRSVEVYDTLYLLQNQLPYYIASADMTISTVGDVQLQYSLSTLQGCDSLIRLQVYVYQNVEVTIDTTVCPSSLPLAWYGHTFPAEGTAVDSLQTAHGSDSIRIYHVFVDNLAAAIGNVTHVDCYGASTGAATAQVTGGQSPLSYLWQNAAGGTVSTTVQMANVAAGAYSFTVTDHFGCTSTDTVTIRTLHDELVPGTIAASQELCDGEALAPFTGTAASGGDNGGYQWQYSEDGETWTAAPGLSTTQDYTCTEPPAESFQLRRAWISATCGTVYSNVVTVAFWPSYQDTLTVSLCQGGSYWENGFEVDETMTGDPSTYFFVQQLTTGHCDSVVVLQLTVNPMYENHIEDEVCEGDGYFANGFSIPAAETLGKDTLLRNLSLQTEQGCDSVVWLHLTIVDTATRIVLLSPDFCETLTAELGVETALSDYEWSTGELTPQITVTLPGIYSVTATQGGCSATARYTIEPCALRVLLPNAISPSKSDGLNDYLFIPEALLASIYDFEISVFNRWGEMVFYSTDKHFKWNGEVKGTIFYNNVYNYVIRCTNAQGKPYVFTGSITVL
jgi:gliding motility-associated-like protein